MFTLATVILLSLQLVSQVRALPPCTGDIPSDARVFCSTLSDTFTQDCVSACNKYGFSPSSIWIIIVLAGLVMVAVLWGCMQRYQHIKHMVDEHGLQAGSLLGNSGYKSMNSSSTRSSGGKRDSGCRNYDDGGDVFAG